jgi:hypothetical protein
MRRALRILACLLLGSVLVVAVLALVTGDVGGTLPRLSTGAAVLGGNLLWVGRQARLNALKVAVTAGLTGVCVALELSAHLGWVFVLCAGLVWQAINDDGGSTPAAAPA